MRKIMMACAIAALVACGKKDQNADNTMGGTDTSAAAGATHMDTSMTQSTVQDTTVVKTDTNVSRDTVKKTDNAPKGARKDTSKKM
jgi:hypothetical protein